MLRLNKNKTKHQMTILIYQKICLSHERKECNLSHNKSCYYYIILQQEIVIIVILVGYYD